MEHSNQNYSWLCCETLVHHCFLWKLRWPPVHHDVKREEFLNPLREAEKSVQTYLATNVKAKFVFQEKEANRIQKQVRDRMRMFYFLHVFTQWMLFLIKDS